ncbi:MAG: DUF1559 domain-containing protein [Planctomycetes bacterium]|nr:DUF1559 domain-containing protein [Planctomycetota bacterium]
MHNYNDVHRRLPPAVVYGDNGTPLLSWRVLILPFVEQKELYDEFKLDESWDSPHNILLLSKIPEVYKPPARRARTMPPHHTVVHVFIGEGTAFEEGRAIRLTSDFPDGTSNTILVVEGGPPVPWTKPEEIPFDPALPLPNLFNLFGDTLRIAFADGSVRRFGPEISEQTLRGAITRTGHEIAR